MHLELSVQAQLDRIARESGRAAANLVQDAVAGYVGELAQARELLDSRYDDTKCGKVKMIPGDEALTELQERIGARRGTAGNAPSWP